MQIKNLKNQALVTFKWSLKLVFLFFVMFFLFGCASKSLTIDTRASFLSLVESKYKNDIRSAKECQSLPELKSGAFAELYVWSADVVEQYHLCKKQKEVLESFIEKSIIEEGKKER